MFIGKEEMGVPSVMYTIPNLLRLLSISVFVDGWRSKEHTHL